VVVERKYDAEKREKPAEEVAKKVEKKPAVEVAEEIAKKIEKGIKQFAEKLKEATEVFKLFTPSVAKGIITLSVTIPTVYLVALSIGTVAPHVAQYMYMYVPIIVQFVAVFVAFSIFALAFGMVRTLVL
jgi:hypothetical protein